MTSHSDTLLAQFRANLNQYPQLNRKTVDDVAKATIEHYFNYTPLSNTATIQPIIAVVDSGKSKIIPEQWPQLINSKEFGVCTYFKEIYNQIKRENPGCKYFTITSEIRNKYEGTPNWQDYLTWVRSNHPNPTALTKDPSPRKSPVKATSVLLSNTDSTLISQNGRKSQETSVNLPIEKVTHQTRTRTKRSENGKKSQERERTLVDFLNSGESGGLDLQSLFPCQLDELQRLRTEIRGFGGFRECKLLGGLGNNYDLEIITDTKKWGVEIKCSEGKSVLSDLSPWKGGVQILQGQFLGGMGSKIWNSDDLYGRWFSDYVRPFVREWCPEFSEIQYDDYKYITNSMDKHSKYTTLAAGLVNKLRTDKSLQSTLHQRYLEFEEHVLGTALPGVRLVEELKQRIDQKNYWININATGAHLIKGFTVQSLKNVRSKKRTNGGLVYNFEVILAREGELQERTMELRFNWKNGGQAVQNLNFMVIPLNSV